MRTFRIVLVVALLSTILAACQFKPGTAAECASVTSAVQAQPMRAGEPISCPTDYPAKWNTGVALPVSMTGVTDPSGTCTLNTPNVTYDKKVFDCNVVVTANNVKLTNSTINVTDGWSTGILQVNAVGMSLDAVNIYAPPGRTGGNAAVGCGNFTANNVHISGFGEGYCANGNVTITNSWFGNAPSLIAYGAHQDGVQVEYGDNVLVKHNTFLMEFDGANSALRSSGEPHNNVVFEDNLLFSNGGKDLEFGGATIKNNKIVSAPRDPGALSPIFQSAPNPNGPVCGTVWYDGPNKGQPVDYFGEPNVACASSIPARPTRATTGPRFALTNLDAGTFANTGVCNKQRINGDVRIDNAKNRTFNITDCEINGNVFIGGGTTNTFTPLAQQPIWNMDYTDIQNSIQTSLAVKWNVNHTWVGNQPQFAMSPDWSWPSGPNPGLWQNSIFFQPFVPCESATSCETAHSEALHVPGWGDGLQFYNVSFELEGGPFTGPGRGGYTGVMNFHGTNATFDSCWFDFGSQVATYTLGWIDGAGTVVKNSALDTRAGFFSDNESTTQATFINNRSLQTGLPYNG